MTERDHSSPEPEHRPTLHVMCERDVGLFSLLLQVVANIPWAQAEGRVPVAMFRDRCCYHVADGYRDRDNVWEYYFEPIDPRHPVERIDPAIVEAIDRERPTWDDLGRIHGDAFVTAHFGDHPDLVGRSLHIPYLWDDPSDELRRTTSVIIAKHVRPREHIRLEVNRFWREHLEGRPVIGVHLRGTDAVSMHERRAHRIGSLSWKQYLKALRAALAARSDARIFLATDTEKAVDVLKANFGDRVVTCEALRHRDGDQAAGFGPDGGLMPAYIAADREAAARNGEEAVIDYLLLGRCDLLVHNSSGLARSVLLANASLPHVNTHLNRRWLVGTLRGTQRWVHRYRRWRGETERFRICEATRDASV